MCDRGLNLVTGAIVLCMRCFWSGRHRLRAVLAAPRRQYAAVSCPRWPGSTSTGPDITF